MQKSKLFCLACLMLLWAALCNGQTYTKKIQLHFATAQYKLSNENKKALRNLFDSIKQKDSTYIAVQQIVINGHTDNVGDSTYNMELSDRRAYAVKCFFVGNGITGGIIKDNYYGESRPLVANKNHKAKQKNRRVEIAVTYIVSKTTPVVTTAPDTCGHDTTITLAQGSQITMSICDYGKMGDDIQIAEVVSGDAVRQSGLTTMADDGRPLMSGGMYNIKSGNDSCFKKPMVVMVPVNPCIKPQQKMMKYIYNFRNGKWTSTKTAIRVVTLNGKKYYLFKVQCPGLINIDCLKYFAKGDKRKFYARDGMKIVDLRISEDCPCTLLQAKISLDGKRAYGWVSTTQPEPYIAAKVVDKNGDTLTMNYKKLNSLLVKDKREVTKRLLGVIPIKRGVFYDKYCLRKNDFDKNGLVSK